ncbi:hypothetical protein TNCV_1857611 [Trichonephila clavipes]|nr:hypothetical protein TNCV_1857611 [Trichonephila clavipes]
MESKHSGFVMLGGSQALEVETEEKERSNLQHRCGYQLWFSPTTVLSSSQNHAMPVKHNVSLLNLPDVEEVPSYDEEIVLSVLPEPPISLNDIEPILHPQQQTT